MATRKDWPGTIIDKKHWKTAFPTAGLRIQVQRLQINSDLPDISV